MEDKKMMVFVWVVMEVIRTVVMEK